MENSEYKRPITHYLALLGGLILLTNVGCIFITGNLTIYHSSYLQAHNSNTLTKDLAIILSFQVVGFTVGTSLCPALSLRISNLSSILIGSLINMTSLFLVPYVLNYYLLVFVYGFCYGFGGGIYYLVPMMISWRHFPRQKGRVAGILMTGFGLGPAVFNVITTQVINPKNLKPTLYIDGDYYYSSEIFDEFPNMIHWIVFLNFCMYVVGIALLFLPGKDEYLDVSDELEVNTLTVVQVIKSKAFRLMAFMVICSLSSGYYIVISFKTFGKEFINDDQFLAIIGSVGGVIDGSSRFFWGFFMDLSSFKVAFMWLLIMQSVTLGLIFSAAQFKILYLICVAILFCCKGGTYVLITTLCEKMFGKRLGPKIVGIISYFNFCSSFLSIAVQELLIEYAGYEGIFYVLSAITLLTFIGLAQFEEKRMQVNECMIGTALLEIKR